MSISDLPFQYLWSLLSTEIGSSRTVTDGSSRWLRKASNPGLLSTSEAAPQVSVMSGQLLWVCIWLCKEAHVWLTDLNATAGVKWPFLYFCSCPSYVLTAVVSVNFVGDFSFCILIFEHAVFFQSLIRCGSSVARQVINYMLFFNSAPWMFTR